MTDNPNEWKTFEKFLVQGLKHFGVIDPKFTGKITLHLNDGCLCDMDRFEVGIKRILRNV